MSTNFVPVDQDARDRIRGDLESSLLVEAGAGTGKTTSLVARIVELLASGRTTADQMVVITFTEKAAAELSSRVREELERISRDEDDPDRKARLSRAIAEVYRARVETIHSFAGNLLRERPVEAGLDPGFQVMTDLEAQLSFDAAYKEWRDDLMEGDHEEVAQSLNVGFGLDEIRETAETLHRFRFLLPLAPFASPSGTAEELLTWVHAHAQELADIASRCNDETDKSLPVFAQLTRFVEQIEQEGTTDAARERLVALAAPVFASKGRQSSWDDAADCKRQKELFSEYRDLREQVQSAIRTRALLALLPHAERFVRAYEAQRRGDGVADFDDLLLWSRDLLRDRVDVRLYFQRRFNTLLIDEFQDTDPVQVEITAFLAGQGEETTDWREVVPAPGKLFLVGDPKQSIYRFRRADIGIYDQVKRGQLGGETLSISQNFRSLPSVIDWVNDVFDKLLVERTGLQPGNTALQAVDRSLPLDRPAPLLLHAEDETLDANGVRETESRAVAALLHQAIEADRWSVRDRASGEIRHAQWRDVAILLPTRTGLEAYEDAFAAAGIPYRHEGSRDYFLRQEVRDLVAILRAVDDPADRISLAGALQSSAFGCSDDDLVLHKASGAPWDYRVDQETDSEAVADAFRALKGWHRHKGRRSLPQLVREVVEQSRLVEFALTLPDGPQAAANLLAIVDQARAFSAAGGGGLRAFTRWLVQSTDEESPEVDAGIAEETDDVVRILTMHGSKGLEFPIVVTANLGARGKSDREPVPSEASSQLNVRIGVGTRNGYYATPGYEDVWDGEKVALDAEQLRLLYVAMTRARDHLIVPRIIGGSKPGRFLEALLPLLPEARGHEVEIDGMWLVDATALEPPTPLEEVVEPPSDAAVAAALEERERWVDEHTVAVNEAKRELPLVVASSVERATRPLSAEASHSGDTLLVSDGPPLPVGDALHLVMERVSLPDANDLESIVDAVSLEAGLMDRRDEIAAMAARCLSNSTVKRGFASGTWRREVPFTLMTESGITTGRVDAVFEDRDGTVVVDFKSDSVSPDAAEAHALEHYGGQVSSYEHALEAILGTPVSRTVLVYARTGTEVVIG